MKRRQAPDRKSDRRCDPRSRHGRERRNANAVLCPKCGKQICEHILNDRLFLSLQVGRQMRGLARSPSARKEVSPPTVPSPLSLAADDGLDEDSEPLADKSIPPHIAKHRDGIPPEIVQTVVIGTNATLMLSIEKLFFRTGMKIADVTYGQGTFWKQLDMNKCKFFPSDISGEYRSIATHDCRKLPYTATSMDAVTLDPAWEKQISGAGHEKQYHNISHGLRPPEVIPFYQASMREAHRVLKCGGHLVVKCQDKVLSDRQVRWTIQIWRYAVHELGMEDVERFLLVSSRPKLNPVRYTGNKHHAVKSETCLWVFRKEK